MRIFGPSAHQIGPSPSQTAIGVHANVRPAAITCANIYWLPIREAGECNRTKLSFATDAVIVAVEMGAVARVATTNWGGTSFTSGGAIAKNTAGFTTLRCRGAAPVAVVIAGLAIVVAALRIEAATMRHCRRSWNIDAENGRGAKRQNCQ